MAHLGIQLLHQAYRLKEEEATPITAAHANVVANISPLPDFLKETVYIIRHTGFLNRDIPNEFSPHQRVENGETARIRSRKLRDRLMVERLSNLLAFEEQPDWAPLMIYFSLLDKYDTSFVQDLSIHLKDSNISVKFISLAEFLRMFPVYEECDPYNVAKFRGSRPAHYVYILCLTSLMLGKQLNASNYSEWMLRRTRSFSGPLGLPGDDAL